MPKTKTLTEAESHRHFAKKFHGMTWDLLDKAARSEDDNERMLDYAHTSLCHWRFAGTAVNHQRGEWLLARVYAFLGEGTQSVKHAHRCLELTETFKIEMSDFDVAFAYEAMARAHALLSHKAAALEFVELAQKAGEAIADEEDRKIFFADFDGGNWNGIK